MKKMWWAAGVLAALMMLPTSVWAEETNPSFPGGRIDLFTGEGEKFTMEELGCPGTLPLEVITGEHSLLDSAQVESSGSRGWLRLRSREAGVGILLVKVQDGPQERLVPVTFTSRTVLQVEPETNVSVTPGQLGDFATFLTAQVTPPSDSLEVQLYTRSDGTKMLRLRGGEKQGLAALAVELAREDGSVRTYDPWFTPVLVQEGPQVEKDLVYWRQIREKLLSAKEGEVIQADAAKAPKILASALEAVKGSGASLEISYFDQTITLTQENLPSLEQIIYLDFAKLKALMEE